MHIPRNKPLVLSFHGLRAPCPLPFVELHVALHATLAVADPRLLEPLFCLVREPHATFLSSISPVATSVLDSEAPQAHR